MMFLMTVAVEVFFDFDSARIPEGTSDRLAEIVKYADENPTAKIIVDGNTDSSGSAEYNVGLSLRRAKSIQSQLELAGVENEIIIVGYGEQGLRRTEAALNRRVNVWTSEDPLYAIIDRSLTRAVALVWDEPKMAAQIEGPRPTQVSFR